MERTDQDMNLHRISLKRQVPVEGNIFEDFTNQKVDFFFFFFFFETPRWDPQRIKKVGDESLNGSADASHREYQYARSMDGSADASHREHPSAKRSEC